MGMSREEHVLQQRKEKAEVEAKAEVEVEAEVETVEDEAVEGETSEGD